MSSPAPRRWLRSHLLRFLLITLLLGVSLWYAVRDVSWGAVVEAASHAEIGWVLGVGIIVLLAHLARAIRWRYLIDEETPVDLLPAFSATVIGYFASNIIPRSGEILRPYLLARRIGAPTSRLLATVVFERILDGVTLLIILGCVLLLADDELARLLQGIDGLEELTPGDLFLRLALPVGILLGILVLLLTTRLGEKLVLRLERLLPERIGGRIDRLYREFRRGLRPPGGIGSIGMITLWTIVIWGGYALSLHAGILAFGLEADPGLDLGDSVVILGLTTIGVAIAPTPGGFGIFHTFARATLVGLYGVGIERAVAFAFTVHFAQYAATMIAGGLFALREGTNVFRIRADAEEAADEAKPTTS